MWPGSRSGGGRRLDDPVADGADGQLAGVDPARDAPSGHHADLRPIRTDGSHGPTSIGDPSYSRDSTRSLVEALLAQPSVNQVLFNDSEIPGVKHWPAHDNHLHIQVR